MGYYTAFKLEISPDDGDTRRKIYVAIKIMGSSYLSDEQSFDDLVDGMLDACKWYDHDEEMSVLSEMVPGVLFTLEGHGEEAGDLWRSYYRDGTMYTYQMPNDFPPFDEGKLE
jgi:hypothetical protein